MRVKLQDTFEFPITEQQRRFLTDAAFTMVNNQTLYKYQAVGISANQLGYSKRFLIILDSLDACLTLGYKEESKGVSYCLNPSFVS